MTVRNRIADILDSLTIYLKYIWTGRKELDYELITISYGRDPSITVHLPANAKFRRWPYKPYFLVENCKFHRYVALQFKDNTVEHLYPEIFDWFPTKYEFSSIKNLLSSEINLYKEILPWAHITLWNHLCYQWNLINQIPGIDESIESQAAFFTGKFDTPNIENKWFVPYNTKIQNW